jgi:hypothetical protein
MVVRRFGQGRREDLLIEHRDQHEILNNGRELLRTLNFYVPPAYTTSGDELPPAKP